MVYQCNHSKTPNTWKRGRIVWNACISMTDGKIQITPGTPTTPDSSKSSTVFPVPMAKTYQLEDGCIRIEIGQFWKIVTSWHLVDAAENQLIASYRAHHT
jgi:hypothetical protein